MAFQRQPGEPPPADEVAARGTKEWRRAVDARRAWVGDQLWRAQATQGLNLSDPEAMSAQLGRMGITPEIGGGRHLRRLFLGDLAAEGFGKSSVPGRGDMAYGLEAYMPEWKQSFDRNRQGGHLVWDRAAQAYKDGARAFNHFGQPLGAPQAGMPLATQPPVVPAPVVPAAPTPAPLTPATPAKPFQWWNDMFGVPAKGATLGALAQAPAARLGRPWDDEDYRW
jgi:hypothetical protein